MATNMATEKPQYHGHEGHRKRLRARILASPESLADYELLEMILMNALPRGDVKPLAKNLIKKFGSLSAVLASPPEKLHACDGVGEAVVASIKLHHHTALHLSKADMQHKHVLSSWQAMLDYCHIALAYTDTEQFCVIHLDKKNHVINHEIVGSGTIDHVVLYPREIVKKALGYGATALILVHNHPSGTLEPSKADIDLTAKIKITLDSIDIALHDHLIVSREGHYSFRQHGLL